MKALVLFNPYSSSQKISKNKNLVLRKLKEEYETVEFFESTAPKSITEKIARDGNSYDLLLVSGGDGTLNEAASGICIGNIKTKLAYIPSGTVNDVGSILGLTKNVKKGVDIALKGTTIKMDICKMNDSYFVYVCAAGKFSSISYDIDYELKKRFGKFAYFIRGAKELPKKGGMRLRIKSNGYETYSNCYLFFGFNYRQFGGFKIPRDFEPRMDDGLIDFTFIEKTPHYSWWRTLRFMFNGDRVKDGVRTITSNNIILESDKEIDFNVDGEKAFKSKSCHIEVLRKKILIVVPEKTAKKKFSKQ